MDASSGISNSDAAPPARKTTRRNLREVVESLSLAAQFRLTAIATVTMALLAAQIVIALFDASLARNEAKDLARSTTASIVARLTDTGGAGVLDDLDDRPEFLAAALRLQTGEVLQQYVRGHSATGPGDLSHRSAALALSRAI